MLAQNFKTAGELGLSEAECSALREVLALLEGEKIPFYVRLEDGVEVGDPLVPTGFNMWEVRMRTHCGTAACFCGWAEYLGRLEPGVLFARSRVRGMENLLELFDPPAVLDRDVFPVGTMERITPDQGARALRSYLTTGEPRWDEALS